MVHPQDVGNLEQFHQVLIDLGESSAISYRHRHREGHYLWFEATIHPVHDSVTGEIQELVAIARDVTERKQKEASLLERSQLSLLEAEIGKALGLGGNLTAILKQCVAAIGAYLDLISIHISTLNSQTNRLESQAIYGEEDETTISETRLKFEFPLIAGEHFVGMITLYGDQPLSKQARQGLQSIATRSPPGLIESGLEKTCTIGERVYCSGWPIRFENPWILIQF